jgi:ATP-binding cassette subfamily F protein 3
VLSGGERNRYALARMLMMPSNFLLLDEPTNHLDMRAKDVLLTALQEFTGTVVFVSHDRYFIDKLATRVFEVADGGVHLFPGNYEDYLRRKSDQAAIVPAPASGNGTQPPKRAASQQRTSPRSNSRSRRRLPSRRPRKPRLPISSADSIPSNCAR